MATYNGMGQRLRGVMSAIGHPDSVKPPLWKLTNAMRLYDVTYEADLLPHHLRVAHAYTVAAEAHGVHGAYLMHGKRGALVHDGGKLRSDIISPSLLKKKGELTPKERKLLNAHAGLGKELIMGVLEGAHPVIPHIADQHPNMLHGAYTTRNGVGGRDGHIKNAQTVEAAVVRSVAIADVWDALRRARPYRQEEWEPSRVRNYMMDEFASNGKTKTRGFWDRVTQALFDADREMHAFYLDAGLYDPTDLTSPRFIEGNFPVDMDTELAGVVLHWARRGSGSVRAEPDFRV